MKWSKSGLLVLAASTSFNSAGCEFGTSCTELGCSDNVSVRVTPRDQAWQEGEYQLALTLDDLTGTCNFTLPDDLPPRGSSSSIPCLDEVEIGIQQLAECTTGDEGGNISQSCQPIPDRHELTISAYAKPTQLSLTLSRDGAQLINESRTLSYITSRPNGPDCEPECDQAQVDLTFE
ncbi:MAG TPA: hypothetical protein VHO25_11200 [Polyangiaceae bacterium]|nr:hypothetical protein [Polyangiaceae bacterium]